MNDYLIDLDILQLELMGDAYFAGLGILCLFAFGAFAADNVIQPLLKHCWPEDPAWPDNRENDPYDTRKEDA